MNADEFLDDAHTSGPEFRWAISADPDRPDHILYYPHLSQHQRCPYLPLHKSRIKEIEKLFRLPHCFAGNNPIPVGRPVWAARVVLHPFDQQKDAELAGTFTALLLQEEQSKYSCTSNEPPAIKPLPT